MPQSNKRQSLIRYTVIALTALKVDLDTAEPYTRCLADIAIVHSPCAR